MRAAKDRSEFDGYVDQLAFDLAVEGHVSRFDAADLMRWHYKYGDPTSNAMIRPDLEADATEALRAWTPVIPAR